MSSYIAALIKSIKNLSAGHGVLTWKMEISTARVEVRVEAFQKLELLCDPALSLHGPTPKELKSGYPRVLGYNSHSQEVLSSG